MSIRMGRPAMTALLLISAWTIGACDYVPPIEIKIPPPLDLSYQTVSMLSTVGQTPRMSAEKGKSRVDFGQGPNAMTIQLDGKAIQQRFGIKAMADCRTAECLAN